MSRGLTNHSSCEKGQTAHLSAHQGSALVMSPDPQSGVAPGSGVGLPMTLFYFPLIKLKCF